MNRNRGLVSKKINRWLQLAAMVECIAIFLCGYFGYLVESILMPFVLVYIYLIVHYPKNFVDFFTGLFNEEAFMFAIHDKRNWNIEPCLALISMNNIQEVARKDGYLGKEKMSQRLASLMPKSSKYKAVFYVGEKSFVVVCVKEKDMLETVEYFEGLREKAKTSPWLPAGTKVVVSYMTSCGIGELSESQVETAVNKGVDFMFDNGIEETLSLDELIPFFKREKEIGKALENALENDALMVYFQPIYSVKEQCFDKAEVLVRLIDDQIGFIPPDEFISLAEQNGRIFEVEKQVIRKACKLFRQSRLAELGVKSININLSLYDLLQKELKDVLFRAMEENCLLSSNVVLEVTETANIEINRTILSNIELLHNNGMLFALDDYGTGYSNIERILTVPFEYVKVDRTVLNMSFVDEKRDIIFAKNVEMLKKCGYTIVVEGAETEEHIDKLKSLNVDYIQGYYYSKPLPINAYVEFLKEKNQIC